MYLLQIYFLKPMEFVVDIITLQCTLKLISFPLYFCCRICALCFSVNICNSILQAFIFSVYPFRGLGPRLFLYGFTCRDGNRSGHPSGASDPAYLMPGSA